MSTTTPSRPTSRPRRPARARRASVRRRRAAVLLAAVVGALAATVLLVPIDRAVNEIALLPLRHEDVIRQQAREKDLDPALVAAVIYAESRFQEGQVSSAGAIGLMQVTPDTARFIARRSGGTAFTIADLDAPQINIAYGSFYLRYLHDRFNGDVVHALAAYNAGGGNVDRWLAGRSDDLRPRDIPFAETRAYVSRVLEARSDYRRSYARELGL